MRCVGIDWGSSSRRAYALDETGQLLAERADATGVLNSTANPSKRDFGLELADFIGDWLQTGVSTVWMSGMVGSRSGWREAPYLPVPTALQDLGAQALTLAWPEALKHTPKPPALRLLPGLCQRPPEGSPDVMRGEETQLLGAWRLSHEQAPEADTLFLLPGTHSKWARVQQGQVSSFCTFMTGELHHLLSQHGALGGLIQNTRPSLDDPIALAAFDQGLAWAREDLSLAPLFRVRAQGLLGGSPLSAAPTEAAARLSGLLIGGEFARMAHQLSVEPGQRLHAIGEPSLCAWYQRAATHFGFELQLHRPVDCHLAALRQLENSSSP